MIVSSPRRQYVLSPVAIHWKATELVASIDGKELRVGIRRQTSGLGPSHYSIPLGRGTSYCIPRGISGKLQAVYLDLDLVALVDLVMVLEVPGSSRRELDSIYSRCVKFRISKSLSRLITASCSISRYHWQIHS